jgi:glycosyltransferase involved in cell wall biosynthesis
VLNSGVGRCLPKFIDFSDAIICVSKTQRNIIAGKKPSLREKLYVIYNPLPQLSYVTLEGDDFAYFGGSHRLKGFHILYKAAKETESEMIKIRATGFSRGQKILHLPNGAEIMQYGWVHGEILQDIYRYSRAIVVPSVSPEPLPYVVYEAMLKGRLVIASNIGGIPEQTNGYPGCFLFPPGNHGELANLMQHIASLDKSLVIELGHKNRNILLSKDQNNRSLRSFVRILDGLS